MLGDDQRELRTVTRFLAPCRADRQLAADEHSGGCLLGCGPIIQLWRWWEDDLLALGRQLTHGVCRAHCVGPLVMARRDGIVT